MGPARRRVAPPPGPRPGPLSLAAPFTTLYHLLPETLSAYLRQYPQVELTLLDRDQASVFALVKAGDIDFGLALNSLVPKDLAARRWQPVDTVLLAPLGHPLTRVRRVTWRQIADYPLIVPPRGHEAGGRRLLEEQFRKLGLACRVILESSNVELSARYVETGLGLAFATLARGLPLAAQPGLYSPEPLFQIGPSGPDLRRDKALTPYKQAFINLLFGDTIFPSKTVFGFRCWGKGLWAFSWNVAPTPYPQTPIPNPLQGVGRGV